VLQLDDRLHARPASLYEQREGRALFVWGDLGQWLVLDAEAAVLLGCFDRERSVRAVLEEHCRATCKPFEATVREGLPLFDALVERGILGSPPPAPSPLADPLRISNLTFNITNRCNLHCSWCYNQPLVGDEVPISQLMAWVGAGASSLDRDAAFIILGGEPFRDERRLIDCVNGAREHFAGEILISTNGTLVSDQAARALASANATVQVSLDSVSPSQHDAVRGEGVFRLAVTAAQRLVDAGVRTILSMVMTCGSERGFEKYLDLAMKIGVHEVRFIPLRRIGRGAANSNSVPDIHACFQRLVGILQRRPELSRLLQRDFFSILMTVCRFSRLRGNCGIGRRCLFVDADGTIFPCPNHRDVRFQCGHVRKTALTGILDHSAVLGSLRTQYRLEAMSECRRCAFRYWCAGDCRAEVLAITGVSSAPSPYCAAIKGIMTDLFWLLADGWQGLACRDQEPQPWS
jgi:radical SAM protein with 4Fe4S-binding SPASM domain